MKKTTSRNLSKRLTQYGSLSAAIAGIANINAQAGYTDPPDIFVQQDGMFSAEIDFNDDSVFELKFYQLSGYAAIWANADYSAEILGSTNPPDVYPYVLMQSDAISNQSNWRSGTFQKLNYYSNLLGNWAGETEKFLGVRFRIGALIHYGWLRLTVSANAADGIWIHDYYFNPTANQPVQAGQFAPLGVEENTISKVKIVALNKTIALFNLPQATDYSVYTMTGKLALDGKITNSSKYSIEANTLSSGIYIIELRDLNSNAVVRKKIVL